MTRAPPGREVRVLLVDDSATSRGHLSAVLADAPGIRIVGQAADAEAGLAQVMGLQPDLILLDLQMPRMDGFTFLRVLKTRRPTAVVVVSSQARRSDVFRALELGALDFVAKPVTADAASLEAFRDELLRKCATVRSLRLDNLAARRPVPVGTALYLSPCVVAIGASTGGPQSLHQLLAALPGDSPLALVIAQHMPERFTGTFAERLSRASAFRTKEAADGDPVVAGSALLAPGGHHLEIGGDEEGVLRAHVLRSGGGAVRYTPSIDRLFVSVAKTCGTGACGVVLTGMGNDGREGILAIKRAGGLTLAESEDTAVVYGMPQAAEATGAVDEILPLGAIAGRLVRFAREGGASWRSCTP